MKLGKRLPFSILALAAVMLLASPLLEGGLSREETLISLRQTILSAINQDRAAHGLRPVRLDPHASRTADRFCELQIREGTSGHFATDGLAPYARYSLAGGNDGLSQNAVAWSANYSFSEAALPALARESQREMMSEVAPRDGHRRTILDPHATHVGIGVAWEGGELRFTQEFLRRYIEWKRPLPRSTTTDKRPLAVGRPHRGYAVRGITVHFEQRPETMSATLVNRLDSYSLPSRRRDYRPRLGTLHARHSDGGICRDTLLYADGSRGDFTLERDGSFSFAIPLEDGPGLYTVVLWVQPDESDELISASNVSIVVSSPSADPGLNAR